MIWTCSIGSLVSRLPFCLANKRQELCEESATDIHSLWGCWGFLPVGLLQNDWTPQLKVPIPSAGFSHSSLLCPYVSPLNLGVVTWPHSYLPWILHYFFPLNNTVLSPLYPVPFEASSDYPSSVGLSASFQDPADRALKPRLDQLWNEPLFSCGGAVLKWLSYWGINLNLEMSRNTRGAKSSYQSLRQCICNMAWPLVEKNGSSFL